MKLSGASKYRAISGLNNDCVKYILSYCYRKELESNRQLINLDDVVHDFMLYGPQHSIVDPFPSKQDFTNSMSWLQKNGYIFLAGDNSIATRPLEKPKDKRFLMELLSQALHDSFNRLGFSLAK